MSRTIDPSGVPPAEIEALAGRFGLPLQPNSSQALSAFTALLLTWNQRINLGGTRLAAELPDRHLPDAFAAARFIDPGARVVDVGSGGGLPAVPLALLRPESSFDLFEATAKKVAFLRTAVRDLGLAPRVRVHAAQIRLPAPDELAGRFDVALSRATFAPIDWIPIGRALIGKGGRVLVFATGHETPALPPAERTFTYASDRRLMEYGPDVPRGT